MGREPLRRRERREAYYKIHNDTATRAQLSPEQLTQLFAAIDKKDMKSFGVRCALLPLCAALPCH